MGTTGGARAGAEAAGTGAGRGGGGAGRDRGTARDTHRRLRRRGGRRGGEEAVEEALPPPGVRQVMVAPPPANLADFSEVGEGDEIWEEAARSPASLCSPGSWKGGFFSDREAGETGHCLHRTCAFAAFSFDIASLRARMKGHHMGKNHDGLRTCPHPRLSLIHPRWRVITLIADCGSSAER